MTDLPPIVRGDPEQIAFATGLRSAWLRRHQPAGTLPPQLRLVLLGLSDSTWWIRHHKSGPGALTEAIRQRLGPYGDLLRDEGETPEPQPPARDKGWAPQSTEYTYEACFAFFGRNRRPHVRINCYVGDEWVSEYDSRFTNRAVVEPTDRRVTWAIGQLGFRIKRGKNWTKHDDEWSVEVDEA
ncbi:hypothetical protein AB0J51_16725 [Micromonospora echinofusca]|uniref:hypothetical protein n=1 Tax=Micromonospora echinofusca TaxID=47858 RepID=UPI0034300A83